MTVTRTHPPGTQIIRPFITPVATSVSQTRGRTSIRGRSLSTASVFGGIHGGMGSGVPIPTIIAPITAVTGAAIPVTGMTTPVATGPLTLTHFGSSIDKAGAEIMNTFGTIIPLAIKVIIALIVIQIALWLIKRRR